jgi:DNA-binding SARP family transcriptional activator
MASPRSTTIELCGALRVSIEGREVELPGRQGRAVFAYLVVNRERATARDELVGLLWPADPPEDPGETLSALLSRVRRVLGEGVLEGRRELALMLPDDAHVDLEVARKAAAQAETALADRHWQTAWGSAGAAAEIAGRGFLTGDDLPWVEQQRREVEELRLRSLEIAATSGLELGGARLAGAEASARELVLAAPFREAGHRLLMATLAARGGVAEALRVYERLRLLLREELGASPGAEVQELHARLLKLGALQEPGEQPAPAVAEEPPEPAEAPPHREERRLVTVLSAALSRTTEPDDPEELRAALAAAHARVREVVEAYGGCVEREGRHESVVLFGAPVAYGDDAVRAVRAALRLEETGVVSGLGVSTGEAIVRVEPGLGISATGRVIGLAADLRGVAGPGGVAVDEATFKATHRAFDYVRVFRSQPRSWRARSIAARRRTTRGSFVGRRRELEMLGSMLGTVREERRPRLVTVVGQAGIGKSRLVDELVARVVGGPTTTVHRGRCLPYGEGITWWALREILWEAAAISLDDPGAEAAQKLRTLIRSLLPGAPEEDVRRVVWALGAGAGLAVAASELEAASPETVADEIGLAWPRLLSALASRAPTVIVIEDLHWAEAPLLDMVERVVGRADGPLLIVATARPEFAEARPAWSLKPLTTQITLEPFVPFESQELIEDLLPDAPPELREKVAERAEGNPFFAEEIVRYLGDEPELPVPDTLRALLAARIDSLPDLDKHVLQRAAVVGRTFWATALESIDPVERLAGVLDSLEERGLIYTCPSSSLPGERELIFSHGLTCEVAYRSLPVMERCSAHARVGAWFERLAGDRRDEFIDLLAHHFEIAASPEYARLGSRPEEWEQLRAKAVRTLVDAGNAARRRLALDSALRFADRALALADNDPERMEALELKARALHAGIRANEALAAYHDALDAARAAGDREAVSRLRTQAVLLCTRYMGAFSGDAWKESALARLEEGLAEVDLEEASVEAGALLVARSWGVIRWRGLATRDVAASKRDATRAIEIAEQLDSPFLLSHALEALTWIVFEEGFCGVPEIAERVLRAAMEGGVDRVEAHENLSVAAICFARAGHFERAREVAAEATRQAVGLGSHRALHAGAAETVALAPCGRFAELREATGRIAVHALDEGDHNCATSMVALAGRALALHESGERAAAADTLVVLDRFTPSSWGFRSFGHPVAELVRPVVGAEEGRRRLEAVSEPRRDAAGTINRLRLELPLRVAASEWDAVEALSAEAHELSGRACAPVIGWIADWADAARLAGAGPRREAAEGALAAAAAIDDFGEAYTAARLLLDVLPLLDGPAADRVAERAIGAFEEMGARASAAEARAAHGTGVPLR